jgi:hypothetical protein
MTRARDLADTQDNLGGAVAPFVGAKNIVINGGMDYWQRGTSFTALGNVYTADRWNVYNVGTAGAYTASRVSSWLNGFDYAFRLQRNSGATSTGSTYLSMAFEGSDFVRFTGGKVTLSFYARKGADYSPASSNWNVFSEIGTNANGALYTGLTGGITVIDQNVVLTTDGARYSFTFDVPSGYRACRLQMSMTGVGTAGANDWMEITGVQMEQGSVATPFARAGGSIGGELDLCQRYFWRTGGSAYTAVGQGSFENSTLGRMVINMPVSMRVAPTVLNYGNLAAYDGASSIIPSAIAIDNATGMANPNNIRLALTVAGATAYRPFQVWSNNNSAGYLELSAEL